MKLTELRAVYIKPETTELEAGAPEDPQMTSIVGIDPAFGPDASVIVLKCVTCGHILASAKIVDHIDALTVCPECVDPCQTCGRAYDDEGKRLEVKPIMRYEMVEGELDVKPVRMCEPCMKKLIADNERRQLETDRNE